MDLEQARALYRKQRKRTRKQNYSYVTHHEQGEVRWRALCEASENGLTLEQAAELVDLKVTGVIGSIKRHTGTSTWPIKGHEPDE